MNEYDRMLSRQIQKVHRLEDEAAYFRKQTKEAVARHDTQGAANFAELARRADEDRQATMKSLQAFYGQKTGILPAEERYLIEHGGKN